MNKESGREQLGREIRAERIRIFGTADSARVAAGVSSTTWTKAERGETVREDRLAAIEKALGWPAGRAWQIMGGSTEPTAVQQDLEPDPTPATLARQLDTVLATLDRIEQKVTRLTSEGGGGDDQEAAPMNQAAGGRDDEGSGADEESEERGGPPDSGEPDDDVIVGYGRPRRHKTSRET